LDLFPFAPIENPKEMNDKVGNVLTKLKQSKTYPALFEKAFGSQEINSARMMQAMSQFMCMLVSANSRYDQYVAGNSSVFSNTETQGLQIFRQKCTGCHAEPLFTDNSFRNNGLDSTSDIGRQRISLDPGDRFKFKVPSLRNVVRTFPYMHKGTKNDLESVLIHYQSGIRQSPTLDPLLKNGFTISDDEKNKLIAFLKTLSDEKFIRNPLFSEQ
jgi:cytochrome c peroxidase